jgi:hypothetical protein
MSGVLAYVVTATAAGILGGLELAIGTDGRPTHRSDFFVKSSFSETCLFACSPSRFAKRR